MLACITSLFWTGWGSFPEARYSSKRPRTTTLTERSIWRKYSTSLVWVRVQSTYEYLSIYQTCRCINNPNIKMCVTQYLAPKTWKSACVGMVGIHSFLSINFYQNVCVPITVTSITERRIHQHRYSIHSPITDTLPAFLESFYRDTSGCRSYLK